MTGVNKIFKWMYCTMGSKLSKEISEDMRTMMDKVKGAASNIPGPSSIRVAGVTVKISSLKRQEVQTR